MPASLRTSTGGGFPPPRPPTSAACAARPARWCTRSPHWAGRMAWMAMANFTPPLSSQDAEMLDLVRVDKARRTICSCSEKVCPRGALHACDVVTRDTNLARAK